MTYSAASPTAMIPLKERRSALIAELSQAFALGELDVDELERRLEQCQRAASVAELDQLALRPPAATAAVAVRPAGPSAAIQRAAPRQASQTLLSVLGGVERNGRWTVPEKMTAWCVLGGMSLDFREADFAEGVTELSANCLMGGLDIIVPPNVHVEVAGSSVMGGFDASPAGADALTCEPIATLRISGLAIAGGVSVETRRIGESSRQARRRIKAERKLMLERPDAASRALPPAVVVSTRKPKP
jgi:Cell wall-active antibiotics response 4TMS YvqF/Domain of unknown function (DUF1707)